MSNTRNVDEMMFSPSPAVANNGKNSPSEVTNVTSDDVVFSIFTTAITYAHGTAGSDNGYKGEGGNSRGTLGLDRVCTMPMMWLGKCVRVVLVVNIMIHS